MKPRLYRYQYISMTVLFCLSGIFLPGILKRARGTAAYPAFLLALPVGIAVICLLSAAFRGEGGIAAIAKRRLGRIFGGIASGIYIVYFLLIASELLCFYGLYLSAGEKPFFYLLPVALSVMLAALHGETVLGRAALLFAPPMLLFALGMGISGAFRGEFSNFAQFSVLSWGEIAELSLSLAALGMGQTLAVMAVSPAEHRKAWVTLPSVLVPNVAIIFIAAAAVLIDGQTPLINDVAYFSPAASGDFSELRIAAAFVLFFCTAFRLSVCLRAAAVTTAELAGARQVRKFVFPYAGVLLAGALMLAGNIGALAEYLLRYAPYIGAMPLVILPLVLLALRGRDRKA